MAKKKASPFAGRWGIESMSMWDADYLHQEEPAYIAFSADGRGAFHFGYVHGAMTCRDGTRGGKPSVEFTWEGNDEMDDAHGSGWAVRSEDRLHGEIAFHSGDVSDFVARLA
ncbi:MAG: hypothetical protein K2W96_24435 [Gemmataceae bacterium]|nr:hypothetical protein [Gemmataceae bacterium]